MSVVALVTAREALAVDEDLPILAASLGDIGVSSSIVTWDDESTDWSEFDAAVIRSPWDYVPRREEFCAWADRVGEATVLLNGADVVRWSTDKHYLGQLAGAGFAVVPTQFVDPPTVAGDRDLPLSEFVIKPTVGAGSKDAARYDPDDIDAARCHLTDLLDRGVSAMIQPYLSAVDDLGETALIYVEGTFSHAMRKGPLLARGSGPVEGLFAEEDMRPRPASPAERALGDRVMAWVGARFGPLLYARVDLVPGPGGFPLLLELELCEPSLFLPYAPGAADLLAQAIVSRLSAPVATSA